MNKKKNKKIENNNQVNITNKIAPGIPNIPTISDVPIFNPI